MPAADPSYLAAVADNIHMAIPLEFVQEVVSMPAVTAVPAVPKHIRGVINLRGSVIRLIDLRLAMGRRSLEEQFCEIDKILADRLEDHKRWIAGLESSVRENQPFKLARNPHMCVFGKWYDSYKPDNDAISFQQFWRRFDGPHQQIHKIADIALDLAANGKAAEAMDLIDQKRTGELAALMSLFSEAGTVMRQTRRELAIVLRLGGKITAITADKVNTVLRIPDADIRPLSLGQGTIDGSLVRRVAKAANTSQLHLLLEVRSFFDSCAA